MARARGGSWHSLNFGFNFVPGSFCSSEAEPCGSALVPLDWARHRAGIWEEGLCPSLPPVELGDTSLLWHIHCSSTRPCQQVLCATISPPCPKRSLKTFMGMDFWWYGPYRLKESPQATPSLPLLYTSLAIHCECSTGCWILLKAGDGAKIQGWCSALLAALSVPGSSLGY